MSLNQQMGRHSFRGVDHGNPDWIVELNCLSAAPLMLANGTQSARNRFVRSWREIWLGAVCPWCTVRPNECSMRASTRKDKGLGGYASAGAYPRAGNFLSSN